MKTSNKNMKNISILTAATERADVFIVPNSASPYSEFGPFKWDYFFWMKKCLELNGITMSEEELKKEFLVQVWFRTPECQDAGSHGLSIKVNEDEVHYTRPKEYLPYSLIKDMVEGDTKTILIPMTMYVNGINEDDAEASYPLNIEWTLTANQNSYRYRNFGPFEKALDIVIRRSKELYSDASEK